MTSLEQAAGLEPAIGRTVRAPHEDTREFSAEWWESRTSEELRDFIKRGFSGGLIFEQAMAEDERRSRDAVKLIRASAIEAEIRSSRRTRLIRILAGCAAIAVIGIVAVIIF
jgi:hypothetical protein